MRVKQSSIIGLIGIVVAILVAIAIYNSLQFHITSITPSNQNYPASLASMDIYFNKKLDTADLKQRLAQKTSDVVANDFGNDIRVTVHDKYLTLNFPKTPGIGTYSITLKNITSTSGDSISKVLPLRIKDIPYDDMSKADRARYDSLAQYTGDDEEKEVRHPILMLLPHETEDYQITGGGATGGKPAKLIITMKFFAPGSIAEPATEAETSAYLAKLRTYRGEALAWIKSKGYAINDFTIEYSEIELQNEFPHGQAE